MDFKRFGDQACIIEFGKAISREINSRVIALYNQLKESPIVGITDLIPAYHSLTIIFDPTQITYAQLTDSLKHVRPHKSKKAFSKFRIPVCYEMALDKTGFCRGTGLGWEEIIEIHTAPDYMVYMIGFLPGFLYLGEVNPKIQLPRKKEPRKKVEKGSVGIAGTQTGIYPMQSPGGWNILGRTPITLFNPKVSDPFPIEAGSLVEFVPISEREFDAISKDKNYQIKKRNVG